MSIVDDYSDPPTCGIISYGHLELSYCFDDPMSTIDDSRSIIDDSMSIVDDYRVTLQLVASFTIVIYNCHIFFIV
jgi:hypothetical protein